MVAAGIISMVWVVGVSCCYLFVYEKNLGATVAFNEEFYAQVFMNPAFHFPAFLLGIMMSLVYCIFKEEHQKPEASKDSIASRAMEMILNNPPIRYTLYLCGTAAWIGSILWQTKFVADPEAQSATASAVFCALAYPLNLLGLLCVLMPALGGKAQVFRFAYGSQTWTMLNSMTIGLQYCAPMVALYYFMSTQHQITITYYMFVYYFVGNFFFGMTIYYALVLPIDRPILALLNLKEDVKDARESKYYKLRDYVDCFLLPQQRLPSEANITPDASNLSSPFLRQADIKEKNIGDASSMGDRDTGVTTNSGAGNFMFRGGTGVPRPNERFTTFDNQRLTDVVEDKREE
uniref:Uncharacterized protein n=1 Tax=Strombidium rassoulzadegani TaxID=1082188 RepID=A0A7S3FYT0_9SPIT|mmetsp:Transcript_7393/g.12481  ORF Transcript_7393/g.12481 Transcript_7393/m.12481 type:complete len:347 (+) Transcript_7393:1463-2503(+)